MGTPARPKVPPDVLNAGRLKLPSADVSGYPLVLGEGVPVVSVHGANKSRTMRELRQALADIDAIRTQVARETQFRGYGPLSTAVGGVLAVFVAAGQSLWLKAHEIDPSVFVIVWVATAATAASCSAWETFNRTRRVHAGFSREMFQGAIEQLLPAMVAGLMLTVVLARAAPQELWMLPGLWQLAFSLAIFASCRFLPRLMFAVALWYLVAGLACLAIEGGPHELSPWTMGVPFGIGQLLVAAVLKYGYED